MKANEIGFIASITVCFFVLLAMPGGPWSADDPPVVRFAFQDRIGSVIPIISDRKGFFEEQGLNVKPLRFSSGPACSEALYSGAADIGGMGDTTAVIMISKTDRFAIVASHATGEHRHRIMVRKDSDLKTIQDLKGKRLGVKKGTSTYGGLLAALEKSNMSPQDLQIVDLTPSVMTDALLAGSLDAFVASEPTPSSAEEKGARELATLGGLGNEYPILILANKEKILSRPDIAKRLLAALKKAEQYAAEHLEETVEIMAEETGLSPDTVRQAMKRHQYRLRLDQSIISSLEKTAAFLKGQGIISQVPDFVSNASPDFIE